MVREYSNRLLLTLVRLIFSYVVCLVIVTAKPAQTGARDACTVSNTCLLQKSAHRTVAAPEISTVGTSPSGASTLVEQVSNWISEAHKEANASSARLDPFAFFDIHAIDTIQMRNTGRAVGISLATLGVLLLIASAFLVLFLMRQRKTTDEHMDGSPEITTVDGTTSTSTVASSASSEGGEALSIEEAIAQVGIGRTQWMLLILCGLTFCSDAAEVTFLSFVTEVLRCEWGLSKLQEAWITSSVFLGMIVGAPIWGWMADNLGRRVAFLFSSCIITSFGFATALCPNFISLVVVRTVVGVGVAGLPIGFDILAEALPAAGRGAFLLYIEYFWTVGSIYVTVCAQLTLDTVGWQVLTALAAVPTLVSTIAAYLYLPESPRWLVDEGREEEAAAIIKGWAKANGSGLKLQELKRPSPSEHEDSISTSSDHAGDVWRSATLMAFVWFAFGLTYYGVVLLLPRIFEIKTKLATDSACAVDFNFQDLAISSCAEVLGVACAICIIDRVGRTWTQCFFYTLGGLMVFLLGYRGIGRVSLTLVASVARLAMMAASCATWVHTPELFPTRVRAEAHGILNVMSKLGAFSAPFLISDVFSHRICASIMAVISVGAAAVATRLPETAGKEM